MASSLSQLSASVTRILSLTGFPKELKTRDIQLAFSEWDNASGGFKIKWIDDTSLLIVFVDATVGEYAQPLNHTSFVALTLTIRFYQQLKEHTSPLSRTHQRYFLRQRRRLLLSSVLTMDRMLRRSSRMSIRGRRIRPGGMAGVLRPLPYRISAHEATAMAPALVALWWG